MTGTIYSLIPALLTIALVILTRRVVLSLGVGALSAAFILANFNPLQTLEILMRSFSGLIVEENGLFGFLNDWNMSIIFFLLALGVITAYIVLSGGASAFTNAIIKRVKSREGVQYTAALLGILIFVDDYFNALVVGNVSKPLAKEQRVSRARLSYIVDSTSAPVCVISPISSWSTGIMGSMAVIFASTGATYNTFSAFLTTIPYHFYVLVTVIMVFIVIKYNFNIGLMKTYEESALNQQGLAGLVVSMALTYRHIMAREISFAQYTKAFFLGMKSMVGAIVILLLAWAICDLVGTLDAGGYLASLITQANIAPGLIPMVMFMVASFMAFATGTSWGSFGILLPIAGSVAAALDMDLMIPIMAAVLSGALNFLTPYYQQRLLPSGI